MGPGTVAAIEALLPRFARRAACWRAGQTRTRRATAMPSAMPRWRPRRSRLRARASAGGPGLERRAGEAERGMRPERAWVCLRSEPDRGAARAAARRRRRRRAQLRSDLAAEAASGKDYARLVSGLSRRSAPAPAGRLGCGRPRRRKTADRLAAASETAPVADWARRTLTPRSASNASRGIRLPAHPDGSRGNRGRRASRRRGSWPKAAQVSRPAAWPTSGCRRGPMKMRPSGDAGDCELIARLPGHAGRTRPPMKSATERDHVDIQ